MWGDDMRNVFLVAVAMALSGCVHWSGTEYVRGPDPLVDKAVTVTGVEGTEVILADGARYHVAGIRAWDTQDGRSVLASELRSRVVHTEQIRLLKQDAGVRLVLTQYNLPTPPFGVILFPVKKSFPPEHVDVAVELLRNGFARVAPAELHDAEIRHKYEAAEREAMEGRAGYWLKGE